MLIPTSGNNKGEEWPLQLIPFPGPLPWEEGFALSLATPILSEPEKKQTPRPQNI